MGTQEQAERILNKWKKEDYYRILEKPLANKIFLAFLKKPNTLAKISTIIYPPPNKRKYKKKLRPTICIYKEVFEKAGWLRIEENKIPRERTRNKNSHQYLQKTN